MSNAETIAEQAAPLLTPVVRINELDQLVQAGAFFGDIHVRIVDFQGNTISDSGSSERNSDFAWFVYPRTDPSGQLFPHNVERWILTLPLFTPYDFPSDGFGRAG